VEDHRFHARTSFEKRLAFMSDFREAVKHGRRPRTRALAPVRTGGRRAQADPSASLRSGRRRRRPGGRRCPLGEGRRARARCAARAAGRPGERGGDDLALIQELPLEAVVLPKATPDSIAALGSQGPPIIAIVETAQGLRLAYETASSPRVAALVLGAVDLGAELGLEPRADGLEILHARSSVVVDSAAAGIRPPFDLVHLDIHDDDGLEAECRFARSVGFRGKACIHPRQVPIVNRVFAPSPAEIEWATSVVAAYEQGAEEGRGVLALDGAMVDLPVVERARRVLAEAERGGG
jgi:citrate lyase beta subunit